MVRLRRTWAAMPCEGDRRYRPMRRLQRYRSPAVAWVPHPLSGTVAMIAVARSRSEMRWVCLIFFLCVPVDSQVTQPWTQSIEALIASGDLPHARQQVAHEN